MKFILKEKRAAFKRFKRGFVLSIILGLVPASAENVPLQVEAYSQYNPLAYVYLNFLQITSLENNLVIQSIKMNRGNCNVGGLADAKKAVVSFNKRLDYGQVWSNIPVANCQKVLEAEITTNQGTFMFNW